MSNEKNQDIFINRELSWLEFNFRVLDLAKDKTVPLGEQLKFASIYASNLEEFFMVRVGSLYDRTLLKGTETENKTGMTPQQQLSAIMPRVRDLQHRCDKIMTHLYEATEKIGYRKVDFSKLSKTQNQFWKTYFLKELFPVLSPQVIDRRHPFPFLRNGEVYVGTMIKSKNSLQGSFGLIPVSIQYGRIVFVPTDDGAVEYALTEEIILHYADLVFGKKSLQSRCLFKVTRNADITVDEAMFDHDIDYRAIMSELLKKRRKLAAVRLIVSNKAPLEIVNLLCEKLLLPHEQVFEQTSPMDMSIGFKISARIGQDVVNTAQFYPARRPVLPPSNFKLADAVQQRDILIQYPYQSMRPFISMLSDAASDPDVISIKMTLYRVAHDSKIIEALIAAAESGKEVVTIVELRARFDEQNNIDFSKQLEEAGCTVIYGFNDYKVHSKLCLITKKTANGMEYITQIGTGNYNEKTSEQYTDLSFITSSEEIGSELAGVFNNLAMERLTENTTDLLVAPLCFKSILMQEMDAEIAAIKAGKPASIIIKCNSISDKDIIEKISDASCAGVHVNMIVRGICCIKAGLPGLTENVKVRSIVGRYLEHSRIYAFGSDENLRIYIASGDFLTRNTQRRVEAGIRIKDKHIQDELMQTLRLQLSDNVNAREMQPDGSYIKVKPNADSPVVDSQLQMYQTLASMWPQTVKQTAEPIKPKITTTEAIKQIASNTQEKKDEVVETVKKVVQPVAAVAVKHVQNAKSHTQASELRAAHMRARKVTKPRKHTSIIDIIGGLLKK